MYTDFFGLKEKPFALLPDPRYLFLSRSHREALAHLLYGIQEGEGFMEVVGQVGTGKTTLCRTLLQRVGDEVDIGFIFNPSSSETELLSAINREFGISADGPTRTDLIQELNRFLLDRRRQGRKVLLVIDEAQNLDPAVLEQIRLISNLETESEKLIQILLFGQPELDENLSRANLRQLRQRITILWRIQPLTRPETRAYIEHRMRVAGRRGPSPFSPGAFRALYRASSGVPRLVNAIADRALLAAYATGQRRIEGRLVRRTARELPGTHPPRPRERRPLLAPVALALVGLAVGIYAGLRYWEGSRGWAWSFAPSPPASDLSEVSAAPAAPPEEVSLRDELHANSPGATAARALDEVLSVWGYEAIGAADLLPEDYAAALGDRTPFLVLDTESSFDQVRELDLPVVLELETSPGNLRYVALVGSDPDGTALLRSGGRTYGVTREDLERHWTGRVIYLWANLEALPPLEPGATGPQVRWLQERLVDLDFFSPVAVTGIYDADTRAALERFQTDHGIAGGGSVGPATLTAIYEALEYGAPGLAAAHVAEGTL